MARPLPRRVLPALLATVVAAGCLAAPTAAHASTVQRVTMTASLTADHTSLVVSGAVWPVDVGRRVSLQWLYGGAWHEVAASRTDSSGTYRPMWWLGPAAATYVLRVVADALPGRTAVGSVPQNVPVPHVVRYLADMAPSAGVAFSTGTVTIAGKAYPKSVYETDHVIGPGGVWGMRWDTAYDLAGRYRTLRATLGLVHPQHGPMGVQVTTDGRTRLRLTVGPGQVVPFRLDVRGVHSLVLSIVQGESPVAFNTAATAFGSAVLQNDTTTDIPSTANTVFLSDLTPTQVVPTGSSDNGLAYLGDGAANVLFGALAVHAAFAPTIALQYTVPAGYTTLSLHWGEFSECNASPSGSTMAPTVLGDGIVLASHPAAGPFTDNMLVVGVTGVHVLRLQAAVFEPSTFDCRAVFADARLTR